MDIDFVIPWVDGDDPDWISEYNKYSKTIKKNDDARSIRYKDYGLLKYWFRSIEKSAPWVRKIHFITNGQKPSWLNTDHPKLNWVKHEDYIPQEYLPVFSSHPIEINMHRIAGLAEHFVYFNDDMYLLKSVKPSFFFSKKGLPLDSAIFNCIVMSSISHIEVNNLIEINRIFEKYSIIKRNILNWFNPLYGFNNYRNIVLFPWKNITGFFNAHLPQPFLKETFNIVWEKYENICIKTSMSKFRSITDINQYLFREWQLCSGAFSPCSINRRGRCFDIVKNQKTISKYLRNPREPLVCINEGNEDNVDEHYDKIIEDFNYLFPQKSRFEL